MDTVPNGISSRRARNTRPKNASDIDISDSMSILRGTRSPMTRLTRQGGYAVSIVKAGAQIVGRGAGKVRPPLSDCTPEECEELERLIENLGPQD